MGNTIDTEAVHGAVLVSRKGMSLVGADLLNLVVAVGGTLFV